MLFGFGKKLIGLDIGTSTIKAAEVDIIGKTAKVNAFGIIPTPPEAIINGEIASMDVLAEAVKNLLVDMSTKRKNICLGLWGSSVIVKKINIPKMEEKLVGEQLRWEAEQYIPFDINEVNLDFKILKNVISSPGTMDILIVAAVQDNIFRCAEVVTSAGFECSVMDVAGFSLANCYEKNHGTPKGQTIGIMNMGASMTNFVVVENGDIVFCRDLPIGGLTYTHEIAKALSIEPAEAESMKFSASSGQPVPEDLWKILTKTHETIKDEIQSSIDFFVNTAQSTKLHSLSLTGGCVRTHGLVDHLRTQLQIPVERFNPFHKVGVNRRTIDSNYLDSITDFAAVALGLGLRSPGDS